MAGLYLGIDATHNCDLYGCYKILKPRQAFG
ncbi:hypothetical protein Golob_012529 [Gossypium lobatum]|uniref:Uncharacterized protein n=1 Tax=Gossypium lobatum TaxID=34289 RepID=A0A7J8LLP4_9ROSI|nr:hypothetical protein [Gossypium lobatum]